jgi:hypothetical protein
MLKTISSEVNAFQWGFNMSSLVKTVLKMERWTSEDPKMLKMAKIV